MTEKSLKHKSRKNYYKNSNTDREVLNRKGGKCYEDRHNKVRGLQS